MSDTPKSKLLSDDTLASILAANPDAELHAVPLNVGGATPAAIVLRTPSKVKILAYLSAPSRNPQERLASAERYVLDCAVYPPEAEVRGWFEKRPLLAGLLSAKLDGYASGMAEAEEEKL